MMDAYRKTVAVVFGLAAAATAASLVGQYGFGMNPCVMCIQQRLAVLGVLAVAAAAWFLPVQRLWARFVAAVGIGVPAVFGLYIALEQSYLQSLPVSEQPSCGAPWTFRLREMPLFDWWAFLVRGTGECGKIDRILGISLPMWSTAFFVVVILLVWHRLLRVRNMP